MIDRNDIAGFGDNDAIGFFNEMFICFCSQRKIVFFPAHHAGTFIGHIIGRIFLANTNHRIGTQISLLYYMMGILFQLIREMFDGEFAFDFHDGCSLIIALYATYT